MLLMFSATYPERTSALVLCGSFACLKGESWAVDEERWNEPLHRPVPRRAVDLVLSRIVRP